jgi:uncharacterized membrane protein YfcA
MNKQLITSFLPALVVWPVWIYCMSFKGVWVEAFSNYYPMTLAMIVGCFIAGSTPLGGAVTAFPVAVLVLKLKPAMGRDFSVLIQSIGMTAAAYLIFVRKKHLVNLHFVRVGCLANTLGIILGCSVELPGFWVNVIYMTYTLSFAILLCYKHMTVKIPSVQSAEQEAQKNAQQKALADVQKEGQQLQDLGTEVYETARYQDPSTLHKQEQKDSDPSEAQMPMSLMLVLVICGLIGGMLTSKIGSGSDTLLYIFGVFIYNSFMPVALPESMLTATSVIVMAFSTIIMSIIRLIQGGIAHEVYLCWGAVLWLVVLGAPIGSLVLNKEREAFFRRLFYCLAVIQFTTFAILKIKLRTDAWIFVGATLSVFCACITMHAYRSIVLKCLCGYTRDNDEQSTQV